MKKVLFVAIATMSLYLAGCSKQSDPLAVSSEAGTGNLTKEQVLQQVTPVIQGFLNAQYDYAMGKDKTPQWDSYIASSGDELKAHIDAYKDAIYYNSNAHLTAYSSKFVFDATGAIMPGVQSAITASGDTWVLSNVFDQYTLTESIENKPADPSDVMATTNLYNAIVVQKVGDHWMIKSWEEHGLGGGSYFWFRRKERMTTSKNDQQGITPLTSYARATAQSYAIAHVNSPSSNYPDYSNNGGDCTNFVNQCLEAGGWPQTSTSISRTSNQAWYHPKGSTAMPATSTRSASWTAAGSLFNFLIASPRVIPSTYPVSSMDIADVIQLSTTANDVHHSMIVTTRTVSGSTVTIKVHYRNAGGYAVGQNVAVTAFPASELLKPFKLYNSF